MSDVLEYLAEVHPQIQTITIDQDFIDHRNEMKEKFRANGREDWRRLMHADCLIAEYALLKNNLVEPPQNIFHDFIHGDAKVDCKIITSRYFNIPDEKTVYYMENIRRGDLTHFAFYKFVENPTAALQVGDVVKLRLCEVQTASKVMSQVRVSNTDGYYYLIRNY
jgi:hypothetical protein